MHTFQVVLRIAFVVAMLFSAARTFWVVRREGFETERSTSWMIYTVTQRWPWLTICLGGAAAVAFSESPSMLAAYSVGVYVGHTASPTILHAQTQPANVTPDAGDAR